MFVLDVLPDEVEVRKIIFARGGSKFVPNEKAFSGPERMAALDAWQEAGCPNAFVWYPPVSTDAQHSYGFY